jgi:endonuclease/exonuclease/phosphatase family metal-dependent hydrolase
LRFLIFAVLSVLSSVACVPNSTLIVPNLVAECSAPPPQGLRIASYNVKSGTQTSLEAVAAAIAHIDADIVALQELSGEKQAETLARQVGLDYVYAATLSRGSTSYGIGLLSRRPLHSVKRIELKARWAAEPRVAIDAVVCLGGMDVRVIATHADVWQPGPNIAELAAHLDTPVNGPTVVLGDLNVKPEEAPTAVISQHGLTDLIGKFAEGPTFWSDNKRLDYLYVDPSLEAMATGAAIGTDRSSDHLPIWADFAIPNG